MAATEALEAAQGEALVIAAANKVALDAAQGEAAANESRQLATEKELKKATSALKKVNKAAADLDPWVRRPSTQAPRFVPDPRVLIVLRGVLPHDLCDAVREDVLKKEGWVLQGGEGAIQGFHCSLG